VDAKRSRAPPSPERGFGARSVELPKPGRGAVTSLASVRLDPGATVNLASRIESHGVEVADVLVDTSRVSDHVSPAGSPAFNEQSYFLA
jgi:hypothetical protein